MLGKTGDQIKVVRPLSDGVIADFVAGEEMVKAFIKSAEVPKYRIGKVVMGVPTGITEVEKFSGHKIHYIGHEKRYGKHLVRFLFKKGGFLEVIVEKPLTMNAHFFDEKHANNFAHGLKKVLKKSLPDQPVKEMFIGSIQVEDGFKGELLSIDKWSKMHRIAIHKTLVVTVMAIAIAFLIEVTKEFFRVKTSDVLHFESLVVTMVTALIIVLILEPAKDKVGKIFAKIFKIS